MTFKTFACLACCTILSCKDNSSNQSLPQNARSDSSIHVKKDADGRITEKWGNYHTADNNSNFRFFYQYDSAGLLTNEKRYFFDDTNTDCIIKDTALYDEIVYHYTFERNKYILQQTDSYTPAFDSTGKYMGKKLYFQHDRLKGRDIQKN